MKVVFDTNIFISALVFPGSIAEQAIHRIIQEQDQLIISRAIIDELLMVLAKKFGRDREELARVAVFMADTGQVVKPGRKLKVLADAADNRILECALAGKADIIVTGDREFLRLGDYQGIRIVSLRKYIELESGLQ